MTDFVRTRIGDHSELQLPRHRVEALDWSTWEREHIESMRANLRPGDVVYDVGSEEGDMPALWRSWDCNVALIEPSPHYWPCIRETWEENFASLEPLACLVGFAAGVDDLAPPKGDVGEGFLCLERWPDAAYGDISLEPGFRHLAQQVDSTPRLRLDSLAALTGGMPRALTIDVEGAELAVLAGAAQILKRGRPLVWLSVHREAMASLYGQNSDGVLTLMDDFGYWGRLLAEAHEDHWLFWPAELGEPA